MVFFKFFYFSALRQQKHKQEDEIDKILAQAGLPIHYRKLFELMGVRAVNDFEAIDEEFLIALVNFVQANCNGLINLKDKDVRLEY